MAHSPAVTPVPITLGMHEICDMLQHRPPALWVDSAVVLAETEVPTIQSVYTVRAANCFGHFPDQPITPWFVWAESAFQAGGLLIAHLDGRPASGVAYEVHVKMHRPSKPGDQLQIEVRLISRSRVRATFEARGYLAGLPAFHATLVAADLRIRKA